jgi:tetratricopeptide (TPR) repeat protein
LDARPETPIDPARFRDADFFVSRAGPDAEWAVKIAGILEGAGYNVIVQDRDIIHTSFMAAMHDALRYKARTIALLSNDYLERDHCAAEWQNTIADDPLNRQAKLIVMRISECAPTGLLKALAYVDLVGLGGQEALLRDVVLGAAAARPGGALPEIVGRYWREARTLTHDAIQATPSFTGRGEAIAEIDAALAEREVAAVTQTVAMHGLGGVGKSTLARQYAFEAAQHDIYAGIWWLNAERETATGAYSGIEASLIDLRTTLYPAAAQPQDRVEAARGMLAHIARAGYARPWLLIYDNVTDMRVLRDWPPPANAQVLLTTRLTTFREGEVHEVSIREWSIEDAITYLRRESGRELGEAEATALAAATGRLPLALSHAAAYLREMPAVRPERYVAAIDRHMQALPPGMDGEAATPVYATFREAIGQAEAFVAGAKAVLSLAACFAPDDIPLEFYAQAGEHYPADLGETVADEDRLAEAVSALVRFSLIDLDQDGRTFSVHRLVQAAMRAELGEAQDTWITAAVHVCRAAYPGHDFAHWAAYERQFTHALHVAEVAGDAVGVPLAQLLGQAANFAHDRAAYDRAEPLYQRGLAIREEALGTDHPQVGTSLNNLAGLYKDQGQYNRAEPLYQRALTIREAALGPDHTLVGTTLNNLAGLYYAQGRYDRAEPLLKRDLAITDAALGANHPDVGTSLNNLAELYSAQGRYDHAEPLYQRALAIRETALGPDHPDVGTTLNNLAGLYWAQGRYDHAEPLYQRALTIRETALGPDHPDVGQTLNNLAVLWAMTGRLDEAAKLASRALRIREDALGAGHPDTQASQQIMNEIARRRAAGDG